MCPVCIATAVWIAASATSTGGVSALFVKKLRNKSQDPITNNHQEGGENDGNAIEDQHAPGRVA
jgi:hypothetical protein